MGFGNTKRNGAGNNWHTLVDWGGRLIPGWNVFSHLKESSADNDYAKGMASDERWKITSIRVDYTATVTVGDRRLALELSYSLDTYLFVLANGVIAASENVDVMFGKGLADYTITSTFISVPTPELWVPDAGGIRVYDVNAVDVADTMDIYTAYHNYPEVP